MDGHPRDRDVVLIPLDAVLHVDVASVVGVLGRELPAPTPQLDPRKIPEHVCSEELVALLPLPVLALEHRASLVDIARIERQPGDQDVRLPHEARVTGSGRKGKRAYGV